MLGALGACNQVFDLGSTTPIDAGQYDAPADAPFACPPLGTAPRFSPRLHQVFFQICNQYSISATGRAAAMCQGPDGQAAIFEGPVDQPLALAPGIPPTAAGLDTTWVVIGADGEQLVVGYYDENASESALRVYRRGAGGVWTRGPDLPPGVEGGIVTAPTLPPNPRVIYRPFGTADLSEWEQQPDQTWLRVATHPRAGFGPVELGHIWMDPEGRRLIIELDATKPTHHDVWTDRAEPGQPFRTPEPLVAPHTSDVYVTADCGRVYVAGLGGILYAQRE